ncbi:MAG: pyridoxal phosphate-dependent aminotransferase [Acidimicrobiales bacterium]
MGLSPPSRRSSVPPFRVMEVMRAAAAREADGTRVLHLEVGQPSTPAPAVALAAAADALSRDRLGYTGAAGSGPLRARISRWYRERYGLEVDPERSVLVTTGASGAFVLIFLACFDPGQRVGVIEPGYPCYRNDLLALGVEVVGIPVGPDTGFRPTVDQLDAAGPLDGLVVASPSNPTGTVLGDADLAGLTRWAHDRDVTLVCDEIYHGITFTGPAPSALAHDPNVIVVNSFSKYFSMTGWRLGWVVAPPELTATMERLAQSLTIAPPTLSQIAGLAAFDGVEELDANVERYRTNRRILTDGMAGIGFDRLAPADGAFYLWFDVSRTGLTAIELGRRWLHDLAIAVTPGVDFDADRGNGWVRLSYAGSTPEMTEAIERLDGWRP